MIRLGLIVLLFWAFLSLSLSPVDLLHHSFRSADERLVICSTTVTDGARSMECFLGQEPSAVLIFVSDYTFVALLMDFRDFEGRHRLQSTTIFFSKYLPPVSALLGK